MRTLQRIASAALAAAVMGAGAAPVAAQGDGHTLIPNASEGTTRVATRGLDFLHLGVGARAIALGGAYTAAAEGVFSQYWNPAGMAGLEAASAAISYQDLYGESGLTNSFLAVGVPLAGGGFGVAVTRFSSGEIRRTTEAFPNGNDPTFGSTVEWIGTSISATYARRFTDRLSFGVSAKMAQEGLDFAKASWVGVDIGTTFNTGLMSSTIAMSVTNLGGKARLKGNAIDRQIAANNDPQFPTGRTLSTSFRTHELQMPTILRFGLRTDLLGPGNAVLGPNTVHTLVAMTDLEDAVDGPIAPALALEYGFQDRFFVRGAKRWQRESRAPFEFDDGLSIGGGVRVPMFGHALAFDYAFQTTGPLGNSQTVSIEFGF